MPQYPIFFTTTPGDCETISEWLELNGLEYTIFYASFLNHIIDVAQHYKNPLTRPSVRFEDDAMLEVLDDFPAQTQGFIDAMNNYMEDVWVRGIKYGEIDLRNGRMATSVDIERAHVRIAKLLFTPEQRLNFRAQQPRMTWLNRRHPGVERRAKKVIKRTERAALEGMGALELENEGGSERSVSPTSQDGNVPTPIQSRKLV